MPFITDIATAVPEFEISNSRVLDFYSRFLTKQNEHALRDKLPLIIENSKIKTRYSCIPDYSENNYKLFSENDYNPSIENRLEQYKKNVVPLSINAIDTLISESGLLTGNVTHIITVSCTGLLAPGLEFYLSEYYDMQRAEKHAVNYLGCYAAIKAINLANHIARSVPEACILIVCTELCSLHFNASVKMEDVIANLIFADGSAALLICGDKSSHLKNKEALRICSMGSAYIPDTFEYMTWNITASSFRMFLSRQISASIKENIKREADLFLNTNQNKISQYAIHPGGIRILNAVSEGLQLNPLFLKDSLAVLESYGNMSSPTILFIIKRLFDNLKGKPMKAKNDLFCCAFGPGLNIEMMHLSPVSFFHDNNPEIYANDTHFQIY